MKVLRACTLIFMYGWRVSERKGGARVIIDVSGEAMKEALKEGVYLIKPNIREFKELVGGMSKRNHRSRQRLEKWSKAAGARYWLSPCFRVLINPNYFDLGNYVL